jgi:rhodanese-related sulfurtransferase
MALQMIRPEEVFRRRQSGNGTPYIIDVRTPAEYEQFHAEGTVTVPLDHLDPAAQIAARPGPADEPLYVICQSGGRAAKACERFEAAGFKNVWCIEGGTSAWERAGLPVVCGTRKVISLERQVRIAAGSLVLVGLLLGWFVHRSLYGVAAFVGTGLVFAGLTDWCGMGMLLAKMPWNRSTGECGAKPGQRDAPGQSGNGVAAGSIASPSQ